MTVGDNDKANNKNSEADKEEKSRDNRNHNIVDEKEQPPSKTNSLTSIISKSSGRVSPEGQALHKNSALETNHMHVSYSADSKDFVNQNHSPGSRFSGIEVNPLYDGQRRKSSSARLNKQMALNWDRRC